MAIASWLLVVLRFRRAFPSMLNIRLPIFLLAKTMTESRDGETNTKRRNKGGDAAGDKRELVTPLQLLVVSTTTYLPSGHFGYRAWAHLGQEVSNV